MEGGIAARRPGDGLVECPQPTAPTPYEAGWRDTVASGPDDARLKDPRYRLGSDRASDALSAATFGDISPYVFPEPDGEWERGFARGRVHPKVRREDRGGLIGDPGPG